MVKRNEIALIYQFDSNWIGGSYYILNIIRALNLLDDDVKPAITIIYDKEESLASIAALNYPFLSFVFFSFKFNVAQKIINKISYLTSGQLLILKKINVKLGKVYPMHPHLSKTNIKKGYYWIPDFQERYLPQLFLSGEVSQRKNYQTCIKNSAQPIVFSSINAKDDFDKFYPQNKNAKYVLPFVSILNESYKKLDVISLYEKFHITQPYFIIPNQFWKHKNHRIILEALKLLHRDNAGFQVIFTGKESDYRNPGYTESLKLFVKENLLNEKVRFLGFIDRDEQLSLMKNSISIIQPSLFEGWSTVVEDCKALNHFILVSDIPLHKEQINVNCVFFDPNDAKDLAEKMALVIKSRPSIQPLNYQESIKNFAESFNAIFA